MLNCSCTKAPKMVSFAQNTPAMYFPTRTQEFQDLLIFPRPQLTFCMFPPESSNGDLVRCRDEPSHRHLPALGCLQLFLKNSEICFTRGGALSLVLSVAFSSLGIRNGHLPLSSVSRYTIDCSCFSVAATFFLSLLGPLDLLVELVMVTSMPRNHKLAVRRLNIGRSSPTIGLNFSCLARFEISSKRASSSTMSMSANS